MPANFAAPPPILETENCVPSQCPEFYAEDALMLSQVIYLETASYYPVISVTLISQVEYRSLTENVTVSLVSLPKSLPPEESSFILQPHNKSCSRKEIEDKCLSKEYHLESFGSLALTEVNPGQFSSHGITDEYIQPGHFPCVDHQSCAKVDLTRAKVCSNDMGDFKDDEVPSLTEPEDIRCNQDKDI
ncbi:hypothetical protein DSO57_1012328 [Entomophthora muscae]|uniref:Uncharacterized protein n=1 Tax=Entomophthora muscae TaxID=34485 RepID=A0ACC2U4L1_9FUNG|nr:hypothetical protein DSO57_1012328 [Entomophthora muscae]